MTKLKVPNGYWKLTDEERKKLLNKCGPDGPLNSVIPNHLFGLDISIACQIHDYTFIKARNQKEHKASDRLFLENQRALIRREKQSFPLKVLRHIGAFFYYMATRIYSTVSHKSKPSKAKKIESF